MMSDVIVWLIIIAVGIILYKFNIIRITSSDKSYQKNSTRLKVKYNYLNGNEFYSFFLKRNKKYRMNYQVWVKYGAFELIFRDRRTNELFRKRLDRSGTGSFEFDSIKRTHRLEIVGEEVEGTCEIDFS